MKLKKLNQTGKNYLASQRVKGLEEKRFGIFLGNPEGRFLGLAKSGTQGRHTNLSAFPAVGLLQPPLPQGLQQASSTGHSWGAPVPDTTSAASTAQSSPEKCQ